MHKVTIAYVCHNERFFEIFVKEYIKVAVESNFRIIAIYPYKKIDCSIDKLIIDPMVNKFSVNCNLSLNPFVLLYNTVKLIFLFLKYKPTIVHTHTTRGSLLPLFCSWLCRISIRIYHNHGFPYLGHKNTTRNLLRSLEKINIFFSTSILTVSHSNLISVVKDNLIPDSKHINVLKEGSAIGIKIHKKDLSLIDPVKSNMSVHDTQKQLIFGYVGRPVKRKGFHLLLSTWQSLKLQGHRHQLIIAGCTQKDAQNIFPNFNLSSITFLGFQNDLSSFYSQIDVLILPSFHEGFGQCVLEAAFARVPTIASNVPGLTCAVKDNVTGLLHEVGSMEGLISCINLVINDIDLVRNLGTKAYQRVLLEFDGEALLRELIFYYKKLLIKIPCKNLKIKN